MKKKIYITCIVVFCAAVAGIALKYISKQKNEEQAVYTLLPRKGAMAQFAEWKDVQQKAASLLAALEADPNDTKSSLRLAALYIQEARETGNYMYYDKAAMKYVNNVLKADPNDFNGLVFKSLIYMSQHHFEDGLKTARLAQQVNPYNAYVYGLLVDGNVEMGNYDSAVAYSDKMVSIRPDLTSYSRISYLREIYGNYKSSIEAMKMAVEAGGRGDEHTEWTRVQLAQLYEKTGDYKSAEDLYNMSLALRPDYPYALAGLARVAKAGKDYNKAIMLFEKADALTMDNSMKEDLIDLYKLTGNNKKAAETVNVLINSLAADAKQATSDENIGHYSDRELAYAYLQANDKDKALEHALLEYNRRPQNIDVNETLAWVYYSRGEVDKAAEHIKTALKTNSKNPVLLSRAGLIYFKAGQKQMAKSMLNEANMTVSYIDPSLQVQTATAMQSM